MAHDVHTVGIRKGSTKLADLAKLSLVLLTSVAVPGPVGEATGIALLDTGAGYTSIPTPAAADGTGATLGVSMALETSALAAAGITYAPGDTITLTGGTASQQAILEVLTTKAVTAPAVAAGGTLYVVGDNITLQNGMVVQVASLTGSAVATVTIVSGGSFTTNNTGAGGLTQVSTTGAGSGATFTMTAAKYGVNTYHLQNAGLYTVLPSSPVAQGSTSGSGTGFTLTASTWNVGALTASGGTGYKHGSAVTFTGGGATRQALGQVATTPLGKDIVIPVSGFSLPASYGVTGTPNAPANFSVNSKLTNGFNVVLRPSPSTGPVLASAVDVFGWS